MNNLINITNSQNLTMSSREIADLCEKELAHVNRDIRKMISDLKDDPDLDHVYESKDSRRYTAEFMLPKDLTLTLVAGYSVKLRKRIINRWLELEAQPTIDPMKALSDPATMRSLLLTYTEKVITLENKVLEQTPKVNAFDRIAGADDLVNLQTAGKILQQKPNKSIQKQKLREIHWIFKRPGAKDNSAYIDKINAGYLATKSREYEKPDGIIHISDQVMVTPKGLAKLALVFGIMTDGNENNGELIL